MDKTFHIVALDETQYLDSDLATRTGRYFGLYVYDPEQAVHACEITPSYSLEQFEHMAEHRLSDEDDGDLRAEFRADEVLIHCRSIEAMNPKYKASVTLDADATLDDAVEYLRCNPVEPVGAFY